MFDEELLEYGVVKSSSAGYAVVALQENEKCSDCSAKIFCKADSSKDRELIVKDSGRAAPGSRVLISVSGRQILSVSFLLYGIPLLLILAGILGGSIVFKTNVELYSALTGIGMAGIYLLVFSRLEKKKERVISKIIYEQPTGNY